MADYFCERLVCVTPGFAQQNRPLRGLWRLTLLPGTERLLDILSIVNGCDNGYGLVLVLLLWLYSLVYYNR